VIRAQAAARSGTPAVMTPRPVSAGGDLDRTRPTPGTARDTAAALAHEGHERTGVATYVALRDLAAPPAAPPAAVPEAVRRDGAEVADALTRWHDALGGGDVQAAATVAGTWRIRGRAPDVDPTWTPRSPGATGHGPPLAEVTEAFVGGRLLRVVNFHSTPARLAGRVEAELADCAARYTPLGAADLGAAFEGRWPASVAERPAVVLAFFDGFANNARVAAPALDRLGVPGWFHLVTGFLDAPVGEQADFAREHVIRVAPEEIGGRLAMTWDEVAALAPRHEVAAHTATHATAASVVGADDLEREVTVPLRRITEVTGRPPSALSWYGGTPYEATHPGDRAAREAGVPFLVSGLAYERLGS
jgi:peptidoglycan/xylan/chitin deacetylase (PgdA/CDA1 family)